MIRYGTCAGQRLVFARPPGAPAEYVGSLVPAGDVWLFVRAVATDEERLPMAGRQFATKEEALQALGLTG